MRTELEGINRSRKGDIDLWRDGIQKIVVSASYSELSTFIWNGTFETVSGRLVNPQLLRHLLNPWVVDVLAHLINVIWRLLWFLSTSFIVGILHLSILLECGQS